MKFFNLRLVLFLLFIATTSFSQNQNVTKKDSLWERKNTVGLDISQIAFVNWNAGGVSSISGLLKGDFSRKYKRKNLKWVNELIVRYGVNKQDGIELRKTDDAIKFNSTIGHRKDSLSLWYSTAKFEFSTQFTNGYSYPNTTNAISKPFAPAYIFLGVGSEYNDKKNNLTVYVSPLTMKSTLVLDQRLANQGAFGVTKATYDVDGNLLTEGELYRFELGFLVTSQFKKELYKNVIFENRLSLYSDYINKFGNVDVDWQFKFDLVVNEYIKANIGAHIIYDDDIKAKEEVNGEQVTVGPKIQLKQMLGVGLVYNF
ncbi:MAG: DUF3078 domain-containing protein [Bacteroidetes bacterium]|jgi:hypothetical protein|uniref:DUF3078 domain-containing protein n=1 Tax=Flavobacterium sp. TaxID=239 RepID=UPI002FD922DE|nr:DUF3078 domain-containing protein [Bacteroidota bacterium]